MTHSPDEGPAEERTVRDIRLLETNAAAALPAPHHLIARLLGPGFTVSDALVAYADVGPDPEESIACPACKEGPPWLAWEAEVKNQNTGEWERSWKCMMCEGHRRVHRSRELKVREGLNIQTLCRRYRVPLPQWASARNLTILDALGRVLGEPPWWLAIKAAATLHSQR